MLGCVVDADADADVLTGKVETVVVGAGGRGNL